jgi:HK97 family phage major capsid protein
MTKLLKKLKALLKQGFASASEKAEIKTLLKELEAEDQEAIAEEVEAVEALPEESEDEDTTATDDEAVKSIMKSIDSKIKLEVEKAKGEMEAEIKKWGEKKATKTKGLDIDMDKYQEWAKAVKGGKKGDFTLEIKNFDFGKMKASTADDMSLSDTIGGELPQAELDPMVSREPQRQPFIEQLVRVGTINSNLDAWIETTDESGTPLPVAELATLPQKSYDFARRTAEVKKIGVYTKHSAELAEDLPNLINEIKTFLVGDLRRVVDTQILSGNGTDEELTGILENAVAYNAGAFADSILEPNRFDVIETAVNQVVVALHMPTHVVLHPVDFSKMRLSKGTDGHYVLPPFIASDATVVSGVRVIQNIGIAQGTFLVGDFTKSTVKYTRGLTVEMSNSDQDDFIKDRFTTKATVRLVHRVRENDYEAFVTGNFDTAIAALEIGS